MPSTDAPRDSGVLSQRADKVFAEQVRPALRAEDEGKYVAIDIDTGDFEIDVDDYLAVTRLRARHPNAEIWMERAGQSTAYTLRCQR